MNAADNVVSYINYLVDVEGSYAEVSRRSQVGDSTLYRICNGGDTSLPTLVKIGKSYGMTIGQVLAMPKDRDRYEDTDVKYFAANIKDAVVESGMTAREITRQLHMVEGHLASYYLGTLPLLHTLQRVSDVLGIDAPDLFLPNDGDNSDVIAQPPEGKMSHVLHLNRRLREELPYTTKTTLGSFVCRDSAQLADLCVGGRYGRSILVNTAGYFDLSVSEVLLAPGVETDWYAEADVDYFPDNLRNAIKEQGVSVNRLSTETGVAASSIQSYMSGKQFPLSNNLQKLADALEMEVADLFLPPEY